jgi:hypothetical protein
MKMQMFATQGKVKPEIGNIMGLKPGWSNPWEFKSLSSYYGKIIYNMLYKVSTNGSLVYIVHK